MRRSAGALRYRAQIFTASLDAGSRPTAGAPASLDLGVADEALRWLGSRLPLAPG